MGVVSIENEHLRVGVTPSYGARVVSLVDKLTGREWLAQGSESCSAGEDAAYLGHEAVGWDECFPTVAPWDASGTPWRRRLRDHGDLWGRPWASQAPSTTALQTSFDGSGFRFARTLELQGKSVVASYSVANLGLDPLPYLWALHGLLSVQPGERLEIPGVDRVAATYLSIGGETFNVSNLPWSTKSALLPFALDTVRPATAIFAGKFFACGVAGGVARAGRPGQWLELRWDDSINHLGIWITYGGWPGPGGHHEIALEPTNAPSDHLGQAMYAGATPLAAGERRDWRVTLTLTS